MQVNHKFNASELAALKIPVPNKALQLKFDEHVISHIWKSRIKFSSSKDKLEYLFKSILHRAFTGDLTASWREAHMKELLQEMELQAKALAS